MKLPQFPRKGERGWLGIILLAILCIGVVLLLVNSIFHWESDLARDFGIASIISAVMGGTVELNLRTQLARDVVEAALGYVFPEEFRAEVRQITSYVFFCERHRMRITVHFVDDAKDCVRVTWQVDRTLRNITDKPQELKGTIHIDEFGFEKAKSEILECAAFVGDEKNERTLTSGPDSTLLRETSILMVPARETGNVKSTAIEIRRPNDHMVFVFMAPTKDPEAILELPPELDGGFGFGSPHGITEEVKSAHDNSRQYRMRGTYFPHQQMRLRFWRKEDLLERKL